MITLESGQQALWQWDTGQRLVLEDPAGTLIDLSTNGSDAAGRIAYEEGGGVYVDIPDTMMQKSGRLYVYVNRIDGAARTTVLEAAFAIRSRVKPEDYVDPGEETLSWHQLEERVSKLEQAAPDGGPSDALRYGPQDLTEAEKEQARKNIDAAFATDLSAQVQRAETAAQTATDQANRAKQEADRAAKGPVGQWSLIDTRKAFSGTLKLTQEPDGTPYAFDAIKVEIATADTLTGSDYPILSVNDGAGRASVTLNQYKGQKVYAFGLIKNFHGDYMGVGTDKCYVNKIGITPCVGFLPNFERITSISFGAVKVPMDIEIYGVRA